MTKFIGSTEAAKMIRHALKARFPKVKFSVRKSDSSIRIGWTDGPTQAMVDAVVGAFSGGGFDGMIDMTYSKSSFLLADGTVVHGNSNGTEGSRGSVPAYHNELPKGAEEIHFLCDYIFTERAYTERLINSAITSLRASYGSETADQVVPYQQYDGTFSVRVDDHFTSQTFYGILRRRMIAA